MDVKAKLTASVIEQAVNLAKNYDYIVSCGETTFCQDMSNLFALDMNSTCDNFTKVKTAIDTKYRRLPDAPCYETGFTNVVSKECTMTFATIGEPVCAAFTLTDIS